MDWPVASVILGILGTVAVAIVKFVPRRANGEESSIRKQLEGIVSTQTAQGLKLAIIENNMMWMRRDLNTLIDEPDDTPDQLT